VKKDYLFEGQMADSADLVVIGAWFGEFNFDDKLVFFSPLLCILYFINCFTTIFFELFDVFFFFFEHVKGIFLFSIFYFIFSCKK
jgi:hypothetical protein